MVAEVASIEVTLRLLGAERFQASMRDSGSISEQTGARVKRAMDGIATSTDRVGQASVGLSRSNSALNAVAISALRAETSVLALNKAFTLLGTAVGGLAGGVVLNAFQKYADTATSIQNRLATVVPIQAQRAAIDQQIFETAQRTRTSYEATANIFSRMTLSASTLGASQSEILRAVEITQKALQAGGATTAESASIATQLTQALGSGRLNGDELKSIAENSPVLIQAIAKEFGVAVGALKDMGANGELVSSRVFKAILNAGKEVDDVFARTSPTIAAGIQQVDNALTRYIGNVDKSIGATKALVGGLEFVARNLDTIGDSATLAVAALAGPIGARLLGGAGSRVAAPFRAAGADARAGVADTAATAAAARAAREAAQAELQQAQRALQAIDEQPRFRQASSEVQRAYERQAAQVDRLEEHTRALDALSGRLQTIKAQSATGELRSTQDLVADRVTQAQAAKAARDRRDSLLSIYDQASQRNTAQSDLGGGVFTQGTLDRAAANLGVNLSHVIDQLRTYPAHSSEAAAAGELFNRVLTEAAAIDPRYGTQAVEAEKLGAALKEAGEKVREFEEARRAAAEAAKGRTDELEFNIEDFAEADINAATQQGRDTADAFSQGFDTQIQTGTQITDSILGEGERAKAAFQEALGQIDTTVLDNALRAVGSSLDTVKSNLDGTKIASGEAGAASIAFAQALQLIQASQPDLAATIAQINAVANAYRQVIGLQSVATAGPLAPGSDKMTPEQAAAAAAKQREQSLKTFNERLEAADKTPAARQRRIGRALPGLTDAEISRLDAAENPGRKSGGRKSPEQRNAETLSKKLEELDQDASVAALNDFDQKTVRFAQSAKVASEQIQAFIAAAKSGDLSSVPPVMQEIYEKMRLLEGVKLGKAALNDIFPGRLLAEQIESVRRAAQSSPEIAANLDLIEQRLREKGAPEWAKDFTSSFTDMVKGVATGTATMADALATFKTRVMNLALDAAFKPLERMLTGFLGGGGDGIGGFGGFFSSLFGGGSAAGPSPTGGVRLFADGYIAKGPGTGRSDSILARISNGEAVIPERVVSANRPLVEALVKDRLPKFADGRLPDLGALTAGSLAMQESRLAVAPAPNLPSNRESGMVTEVYVSGGDKTGAETTMGPRGPRTEITIDKTIAAALLSGSETRAALKKLTGGRMTGG